MTRRTLLKSIGIILLAMVVYFAFAKYIRVCQADESYSFSIQLSQEIVEVNARLSQMHLPKKLLQPGALHFTSGHNGGIKNDTDSNLNIRLEVLDNPYDITLTSSSRGFNPQTGKFQTVKSGKNLNLSVDIRIARNQLDAAPGQTVTVLFLNDDTGEVITRLNLNLL